jgi:PAS domain S-box-containing protein
MPLLASDRPLFNSPNMSTLLNKLLSLLAPRKREYLIVDERCHILEISFGARRFAECPDEVAKGNDVCLSFPELFGLEDIFSAIVQGQQTSFELPEIGRLTHSKNPLYFSLYIIKDRYSGDADNRLIILIEDITESTVLQQKLVQETNKNSLTLSALEATKAYIEKIVTSMADALLVTTELGTIKTVNQATQALLEYDEDELIGQSISQVLGQENAAFLAEREHLSSEPIEVTCRTKIGETVIIAFSCSTIETDIEGVQNSIYIGRDITERKRSQRRLAVQLATTRSVAESTTIEEATPKILQGICESLAWDLGEFWIVQKHLQEGGNEQGYGELKQLHPSHSPASSKSGQKKTFHAISAPYLRCIETWTQPSLSLAEFRTLSDRTTFSLGVGLPGRIWASSASVWIPDITEERNFLRADAAEAVGLHGAFGFPVQSDGEVFGVMTFFSQEVCQIDWEMLQVMAGIGSQLGQFVKRKQAEAALRESEEQYRDLFENATDLIQSATVEGHFLYVNRSWKKVLGYTDEDVSHLTLFDVMHPDCREQGLELFKRVIAGETNEQVQVEFITKDGRKISLEGSLNCKAIEGKPVATRGIFRDITERLEAEAALRLEQEKAEHLLLNILPEPIADRLKREQSIIADDFGEVTVMFADIVGFTQLASTMRSIALVDLLNQIFSSFDRLCERHGLEKIKTIGDAYMVVGGLPTQQSDRAEAVAEMALDMQEAIAQFKGASDRAFNLRIGIHTGPVIAGVIGLKKFSYDLWGDTVNVASRMESHSLPGKIQVTQATYERLKERYLFDKRGAIEVKGKGKMTTYFLTGRGVGEQGR